MAKTTKSKLRRRETTPTTEEEILIPRETTPTTREEILKSWKVLGLEVEEQDLGSITSLCEGFEGDDLRILCTEAFWLGYKSSMRNEHLSSTLRLPLKPKVKHFVKAKKVALKRITSGLDMPTWPKVTWEDIGGLQKVKEDLRRYVLWALRCEAYCPRRAILLYGPQGCGKTSLVKAVAHAARASLFRLGGAALFSASKEGGEELIRRTFRAARICSPSIIFLDDMECIFIKSGDRDLWGQEYTAEDVLHAQQAFDVFLAEMKGLEDAKGVVVVSIIDACPEVLMSHNGGPFGEAFHVPLPDLQARKEILNIKVKPMKFAADVNLEYIAQKMEVPGINLHVLVNDVKVFAKDFAKEEKDTSISMQHFKRAGLTLPITPGDLEEW